MAFQSYLPLTRQPLRTDVRIASFGQENAQPMQAVQCFPNTGFLSFITIFSCGHNFSHSPHPIQSPVTLKYLPTIGIAECSIRRIKGMLLCRTLTRHKWLCRFEIISASIGARSLTTFHIRAAIPSEWRKRMLYGITYENPPKTM